MKVNTQGKFFPVLIAAMGVCLWPLSASAAAAPSETSLSISAGGVSVTTAPHGDMITLTAKVTAGAVELKTGQVKFCDGWAQYCTDIHMLGTSQLTKAGSATLKLRPGVGSHRYKAIFVGTKSYAGSASGVLGLEVTGKIPSITTIAQSGAAGGTSLTATVSAAVKSLPGPTGKVSFLDTTHGNAVLATAVLGEAAVGPFLVAGNLAPTGNGPGAVVAGDFNGDGNLDLAVGVSEIGQTVSILLGDGAGNFKPVTKSLITAAGSPVLVADFNGDGIPDLLLASELGPAAITVLLGNGDGTFRDSVFGPMYTNYGVSPAVVADFNGDGIPDLALAGGYYLSILLGNGGGGFEELPVSSSIAIGASFGSMVAGDFNGDGIPDLAAMDSLGDYVWIYFGNGDGTFTQAAGSPLRSGGSGVLTAGDLNGDGKLDLVFANYRGLDNVGVMLGHGNGTFDAPVTSPMSVDSPPFIISIGDYNTDGIPDLFLGAQTNGQSVDILLGKGDGTFRSIPAGSVQLPCCSNVVVGDFNNDGLPDVAASSSYYSAVQMLMGQLIHSTASVSDFSTLVPGTHTMVANFPGDSRFYYSESGTTTIVTSPATPVISPAPGTYTTVQTVKISEASPGATIYYTTDGLTPNQDSAKYTGPIKVSASETIEAVALVSGAPWSPVATSAYVIHLPLAATPVISLAAGVYPTAQTVTIADATPGATIYYTTNGSAASAGSQVYEGPIKVSSSETLVAIALGPEEAASLAASAEYIIRSSAATPFIFSVAGDGEGGYSGDGGLATQAGLNFPEGVAVDGEGNLFIADTANNRLRKVAAGTRVVTTVAGNGTPGDSGDEGLATSAEISATKTIAVDGAGDVFFAPLYGSEVRRVDLATGVVTIYAGNGGYGDTGDGGPATSAAIGGVNSLATDAAGNLYVAEGVYQGRIRKVTAKTGIISTVAGNGMYGFGGDGGPATKAELGDPQGVAVDSAGNLYIADAQFSQIRKVTASTGIISTVAGSPVGAWGYSGDGGPATKALLNKPAGLAVDGEGNLYINDLSNNVIRKVTASTGVITTLAGSGSYCYAYGSDGGPAADAGFCEVEGISADKAGDVYVADSGNHRVREVTLAMKPPAAATATPVLSVGTGSYGKPQTVAISDATPGASIYITLDGTTPSALSAGYRGPIDISGSVTLRAIAIAPGYLPSMAVTGAYTITSPPAAVISTVAGSGVNGYRGAGGAATSAELSNVGDVALDAAGNLYVVDSGNNVVWKVAAKTGIITVFAGNGSPGYSGDGGPATQATFNFPSALAVDKTGDLYISDFENNVVRKVTASTGVISTYAGNGQMGYLGDGGPATAAEFNFPEGLALDGYGNLYIADNNNNAVRMVNASTGKISTVAGNGSYGFSGNGGVATKAEVGYPDALAFDRGGNLYISCYGGVVRKVESGTRIISLVAGTEDLGNSGDGGLATKAEVWPFGVAVDVEGNVYISSGIGSVREVSAATGLITTVAGNGIEGFSGDGGSASVAELNYPSGLRFDAAGDLYIADAANFRVRKVTFAKTAAGSDAGR